MPQFDFDHPNAICRKLYIMDPLHFENFPRSGIPHIQHSDLLEIRQGKACARVC
jgi:hypothetical protein